MDEVKREVTLVRQNPYRMNQLMLTVGKAEMVHEWLKRDVQKMHDAVKAGHVMTERDMDKLQLLTTTIVLMTDETGAEEKSKEKRISCIMNALYRRMDALAKIDDEEEKEKEEVKNG